MRRRSTRLASRLGEDARILIYLSVPPTAMQSMIGMLGREHLAADARVIIEKPFGTDLASSRDLDAALKEVLDEEQVYRIDHFLGKEAVQNPCVAVRQQLDRTGLEPRASGIGAD